MLALSLDLTRLLKALYGFRAADEETGMLFLSLSDRAGGATGWLTEQLERKALAQARRLPAGSDKSEKRLLAEDWCVTVRGTLGRVSHCQSGNVSAKRGHFTNLTPCTEGWESQGVTGVSLGRYVGRVSRTYYSTISRISTSLVNGRTVRVRQI